MIGVVCDFYYPSIGGTQKLCQSVVDIFREAGNDVEVITTHDTSRDLKSFDYSFVEMPNLDFLNKPLFWSRGYDSVFVFADLGSQSLHTIQTSAINHSVLVLNLDENVYKWVKNEEQGYSKQIVSKIVERIKTFDTVVSFCKDAPVNKFLEENNIEYVFIPNFSRDVRETEKKEFDLHETLGLDKNKKVIFNHGLFEKRKNQLHLIENFHKAGMKQDYSLVFLGSPRDSWDVPYFKECKKFVEDNDLQENIKFIKGTNNNSLIDSLLLKSDVYVLPSTAEGLPLVLIEAMSAGLPWVSTPVGGVPSVMGPLHGGVVLDKIDFNPEELKNAISSVLNKNSREDWEKNFSKEIASKNYLSVVNKASFSIKEKFSFVCPAYNEEETIGRYLKSCLQFSDILSEVYIINHRSSDNTLGVIKSFQEQYRDAGIKLNFKTEKRDFSKEFTLADLRHDVMAESSEEIVFMHDADFVFGKGYLQMIKDSLKSLRNKSVYTVQYGIPVLDEDVCKMHVPVPRVMKKSKTQYRQDHVNGKHEWARPTDKNCQGVLTIPVRENSLVSINTKTEEAKELRRTMTTFFEDIYSGRVTGSWFDSYDADRLRKEEVFFDKIHKAGNYQNVDIDLSLFSY